MTLGERIQAHRKQSSLSQEKLAEMVGVSRQAVTKWESNQSVPSMENLIKLSEIFKISLDQLSNGNINESNEQAIRETPIKRDRMKLIVNLTLVGFIFIAAASSGYYQDIFFDSNNPIILWICMGFIGGILIMIRDKLYYNEYQRLLFGYDLLFVVPVIFIPMLPIRHDISLMLMLVFAVAFIVIFIHKKLHPLMPTK